MIYTAQCVMLFDAGSIHYLGKWEGVGPWKSRVFWALCNGIEPIGKCYLGPNKLEKPQYKHYTPSTGSYVTF
jgi:hypothetical protein